jgi:hypothetical protein
MIVNLPSCEGLNTTALTLYFRAWHSIVLMLHEFDQHYPSSEPFNLRVEDEWREDRNAYLEECQEDLQAALAVIQQSNELALKSRIADVGPYLLLVNSDLSFSNSPKEIDFGILRTIDAVDLPRAVNTLCPTPLSAAYVEKYTELRILRNQYTHLGDTNVILDPLIMLKHAWTIR